MAHSMPVPVSPIVAPGRMGGASGWPLTPIVPPMAAIANAMEQATGIRFTELPMSPPRVLKALRERGVTGASNAAKNGGKNGGRAH